MKSLLRFFAPTLVAISVAGAADVDVTWSNKIAQTTLPFGPTTFINNIAAVGSQDATIAVAESQPGLKFELFTVPSNLDQNSPYLLQTTSVGVFPTGQVVVDTEDPYNKEPDTDTFTNVTYANPTFPSAKVMPVNNLNGGGRRTRADRPFRVYASLEGILTGPADPAEAKSINFYRLVKQAAAGAVNAPQPLASEVGSPLAPFTTNGPRECSIAPASRGSNPRKYCGVEQFSLWSLAESPDPNMPGEKIGSAKVEIYPLCDGSISGIAMNDLVRFSMPKLTFVYNDVYPGPTNSAVYAQIYKGEKSNTVGVIVPGSHKNNSDPQLKTFTESTDGHLDQLIDSDGRWTIELLSDTPFGVERMLTPSGSPAYVTFTVQRTMQVNGTVTTIK